MHNVHKSTQQRRASFSWCQVFPGADTYQLTVPDVSGMRQQRLSIMKRLYLSKTRTDIAIQKDSEAFVARKIIAGTATKVINFVAPAVCTWHELSNKI